MEIEPFQDPSAERIRPCWMATKITRVMREASGSSALVRRPKNRAMNSIMVRLLLHWLVGKEMAVSPSIIIRTS